MNAPQAPADRVMVVVVDLDDPPAGGADDHALLSDLERARAARYIDPVVGRRFVAGRAALRRELAGRVGAAAHGLTFGTGEHGKPCLLAPHGHLAFNVAHSAQVALIATCAQRQIGVDIEHIDRTLDRGAVLRRAFSPFERARLEALPLEAQRHAFFEAWTRKEAWSKAVGSGLTTDFARVEVSFGPDVEPAIIAIDGDRDAARRWQVTSLQPRHGFVAAVVVERRGATS